MNVLKRLYEFIITIQIVLMTIFIIENINNLESIAYTIDIGVSEIMFTLNIYAALGIMLLIFGLILVSSFSILGLSINSEGTRAFAKYLSMIMLYLILGIGSTYYLTQIGQLGTIMLLIITLIYVFYAFSTMVDNNED